MILSLFIIIYSVIQILNDIYIAIHISFRRRDPLILANTSSLNCFNVFIAQIKSTLISKAELIFANQNVDSRKSLARKDEPGYINLGLELLWSF